MLLPEFGTANSIPITEILLDVNVDVAVDELLFILE
jgi:hypothetical protein